MITKKRLMELDRERYFREKQQIEDMADAIKEDNLAKYKEITKINVGDLYTDSKGKEYKIGYIEPTVYGKITVYGVLINGKSSKFQEIKDLGITVK